VVEAVEAVGSGEMQGTDPEDIIAKSLMRRTVLSANVLEARRKSMQHLREWGWSDMSDMQ
jgi:hypothetical protein